MINIDAIRAANPLPAIAAAQVRLQRAGNEWKGCCPFHADKTPSFTIYGEGPRQRFKCFGCGAQGDAIDYVALLYGLGMVEAARVLCSGDLPTVEMPTLAHPDRANRAPEALAIWGTAIPTAGTPAQAYLESRGIDPPFPPDIRFARLPYGNSSPLPCLVAAVRDVAGEVTGLQRTYLRSDGSGKADLPKAKLSLGKVAGGAIRLGNVDASGVATVCEGLEDGLSLLAMLGKPVWVGAGASMLPAMLFPPEVRSVIIGADNDPAGRTAARKAAVTFASRGVSVRIIYPLEGYKDFNDELREARA
jgi:DNA primase